MAVLIRCFHENSPYNMSGEFEIYQPSASQQRIVSLLAIVPSILSLLGSGAIISAVWNDRKRSPYRRILFALSALDLVSTVGYVLQPYLGPQDHPYAYAWAIGNQTTCTVIGALNQFGFSAHWYAGALSFYFLKTVRHGVREEAFAKTYEHWIHVVIISWSAGTAIAGVATKMYHQRRISPGCWISHPPTCSGLNCKAEIIAWIFGGLPVIFSQLFVIINNLLIYCHVRTTIREGQKRAVEAEKRLSTFENKDANSSLRSIDSSTKATSQRSSSRLARYLRSGSATKMTSDGSSSRLSSENLDLRQGAVLQSVSKQRQRVRDVGTQSFLYVGAYFITFIWASAIGILDGRDFEKKHADAGNIYYPLLILQSIFVPAQGLANALVFFRPKFIQSRKKYPSESIFWCLRRTVFGDKIQPSRRVRRVSFQEHPVVAQVQRDVSSDNVESESLDAAEESSHFFLTSAKFGKMEGSSEAKIIIIEEAEEHSGHEERLEDPTVNSF